MPRELFPQFRGWAKLRFVAFGGSHPFEQRCSAFLATPHEVSAELAPRLIEAGIRVVDLSGLSVS